MKKLLLSVLLTLLLLGVLAVGTMAEQAMVGMDYWVAVNDVKLDASGDSSFRTLSFRGEMPIVPQWSVGFLFETGDGDDYENGLQNLAVDLTNMQIGAKYEIEPGITVNGGYLSAEIETDGIKSVDYIFRGLFAGLSANLLVSEKVNFHGDFAYSPFLNLKRDFPSSSTLDSEHDASFVYVDLRGVYSLSTFDFAVGYRMRNYRSEIAEDDIKFEFSGPYLGISTNF